MPKQPAECSECGDETDEATKVKDGRVTRYLCPDCHELFEEQEQIAEEAGRAMREMMEYKS